MQGLPEQHDSYIKYINSLILRLRNLLTIIRDVRRISRVIEIFGTQIFSKLKYA